MRRCISGRWGAGEDEKYGSVEENYNGIQKNWAQSLCVPNFLALNQTKSKKSNGFTAVYAKKFMSIEIKLGIKFIEYQLCPSKKNRITCLACGRG